MEKILTEKEYKELMSKLILIIDNVLKAISSDSKIEIDKLFSNDKIVILSYNKVLAIRIVYSLVDAILDAREHGFRYIYDLPVLDFKYSEAIQKLIELKGIFNNTEVYSDNCLKRHSVVLFLVDKLK